MNKIPLPTIEEIIREEFLEPKNLSMNYFKYALGIEDYSDVNLVKFAKYFGMSDNYFVNLNNDIKRRTEPSATTYACTSMSPKIDLSLESMNNLMGKLKEKEPKSKPTTIAVGREVGYKLIESGLLTPVYTFVTEVNKGAYVIGLYNDIPVISVSDDRIEKGQILLMYKGENCTDLPEFTYSLDKPMYTYDEEILESEDDEQ